MARVIVLSDADHLYDGIDAGEVIMAERIEPLHLDDPHSSFQFLGRLGWAIRDKPIDPRDGLGVSP